MRCTSTRLWPAASFSETNACSFSVLFVAVLSVAGCGPKPLTAVERQAEDLASYRATTTRLEGNREQVLTRAAQASEIAAVGDALFWLSFESDSPSLHRLKGRQEQLRYGFSIGDSRTYNYRASDQLVVTATARTTAGNVGYRAYAASEPAKLLGVWQMSAPTDGQRWWAYAVDRDAVYVAKTEPAELWKWVPGGEATRVVTFRELGATVEEFWDFDIDGDTLIFLESGRIWVGDLAAKTARWLRNAQEVSGSVWFDKAGVLVETASGPRYYSTLGIEIDVAKAIKASTYRLSETFPSVHHYKKDAALRGSTVFYVGNDGVFAFDLKQQTVTPLLLNSLDPDVLTQYLSPQPLETSGLYVMGVERGRANGVFYLAQ